MIELYVFGELINHQLAASNTIVELHSNHVDSSWNVQLVYVVVAIDSELTNHSTIDVYQASTQQYAVVPVVVNDQLVLRRVWSQSYVGSQVGVVDTYCSN